MRRNTILLFLVLAIGGVGAVRGQNLPVTGSTASNLLRHPADPASCVMGQIFFDTTTFVIRVCGPANVWSSGDGPTSGANAELSNLTDPTLVNVATFTFAGAGGLKASGTSHNIVLQPSGPADSTTAPPIGSILFLDPTSVSALSFTTEIVGGSAQSYLINDAYDVGSGTAFLRLVGQFESNWLQIGDGLGNSNSIASQNVTVDDGSGNATATIYNAITGYQQNGGATVRHFLRGNGTNFVDAAIQAADVPTLNQSTSGNAATAAASDHSPTQCSGNNFSTGVTTTWASNCAQPAFSNLSGSATAGQLPASVKPLRATSSAIGGGALLPGACTAGTVTVTGATTAMVSNASAAADPDSTLSTGISIYSFVSSSDTVTIRVCAIVAVTPTAVAYNVAVIP